MSLLVYVLNGPNLNLLGKRQPDIYGYETLADVERECRSLAEELGLEVRFPHAHGAILDALNPFEGTVIEVHISNVHKREEFRHHSFVSKRADGVIAGFGTQGYLLGLRRVAKLLAEKKA